MATWPRAASARATTRCRRGAWPIGRGATGCEVRCPTRRPTRACPTPSRSLNMGPPMMGARGWHAGNDARFRLRHGHPSDRGGGSGRLLPSSARIGWDPGVPYAPKSGREDMSQQKRASSRIWRFRVSTRSITMSDVANCSTRKDTCDASRENGRKGKGEATHRHPRHKAGAA